MAAFKQIDMKFWQNDFVLGLSAEERYFYIYLITNSMTNQCGIYKFNRKLVELEIGYSTDKIEEYLLKFQNYGKVIVSQTTAEIMLVNWFKHNFKSNKKAILLINAELKDIKDKALLKKLYESCSNRQYPVAEIFSGIALSDVENGRNEQQVKASSEAVVKVQGNVKSSTEQDEKISNANKAPKQSLTPKEMVRADSITISDFKNSDDSMVEHEIDGDYILEEAYGLEDDLEGIDGGIAVASWSFTNEDTAVPSVGRDFADYVDRNTT